MGRFRILMCVVITLLLVISVSCGGGSDSVTGTCGGHDHQGCCSSHGGVSSYDPDTCRIICGDGSLSPTCYW